MTDEDFLRIVTGGFIIRIVDTGTHHATFGVNGILITISLPLPR